MKKAPRTLRKKQRIDTKEHSQVLEIVQKKIKKYSCLSICVLFSKREFAYFRYSHF